MGNIKETWQKKSMFERVATIVTLILSCCVIILSLISLTGLSKFDLSNYIVLPMLGIITLLNGFIQYKINKTVGIFLWSCAGLIFTCFFVVYASML